MARKKKPFRPLKNSTWTISVLSAFAFSWYVAMSYWSSGFYGQDEVTHFLKAIAFWDDPQSILSYWQRPGFKILYVIPALGGVKVVHVLTTLLTVGTSVMAYKIARHERIENAYLTALFCAFQPLLVQLSFRMYSEVLAGFLLTLVIYTYLRKNWHACALITGYLFTVRQEFGLLGVVLIILFLKEKRFVSLGLMALFPLALAALGWHKSGNPLWLLEDFLPLTSYKTPKPGFWHYWANFAAIFGAPVTAFFLVGFLRPLLTGRGWWAKIKQFGVFYFVFLTFFLLQCLLVAKFVTSPSAGHFRYLLYLAPLVALFANIGFNQIWRRHAGWKVILSFALIWLFLAALTTYHHNYYHYQDQRDIPSLIALLVMGLVILVGLIVRWRTGIMVSLLTGLLFAHTFVTERPMAYDSETEATKDCADWIKEQHLADGKILANHSVFAYFLGPNRGSKIKLPSLFMRTIDEAAPGTILVWDNHYGHHLGQGTDVDGRVLVKRPDTKLLANFTKGRFQIAVFRKVAVPDAEP